MLRVFAGMFLMVVLASSVFAYKIHHGKLIKYQEWTTGSGVERIHDSPIQSNFRSLAINHFSDGKDGIAVKNKVFENSTGVVGQKTVVNGHLNVYVENFNSSSAKTYTVFSHFCLADSCAHSSYELQLDPHGYFELDTKRAVTFVFDSPGNYKAILATVVDGDSLSSVFASFDENRVEIISQPE
jgi:hypothetical protein